MTDRLFWREHDGTGGIKLCIVNEWDNSCKFIPLLETVTLYYNCVNFLGSYLEGRNHIHLFDYYVFGYFDPVLVVLGI